MFLLLVVVVDALLAYVVFVFLAVCYIFDAVLASSERKTH